jgi:fructose/tagatose bisphosphate aldolase
MVYNNESELLNNRYIAVEGFQLSIKDVEGFKESFADDLVKTIILADSDAIRRRCFWIAYEAGAKFGVIPSSIQGLYAARGRGEITDFTVPAINIRTLTYDLARAVFRSAKKINAGAFIFEIAKSEIGYTYQSPLEYVSLIILSAIKENYIGPIFILGDHFQTEDKKYFENPEQEINELKSLILDAVKAGFYNIDIDSSTLVSLTKPTVEGQQELNYKVCGQLTKYIRSIQPKGIEISIGGEIGEVGGKNSVSEEAHAFIQGYLKEAGGLPGISKLSIQTGTVSGGVVLPDGSIANVKLDFDTLEKLSQIVKQEYGLAGCVQHGASTLPNEAFHKFPQVGCAEIHLATQFQNIAYDYFPLSLKEKIYDWLKEKFSAGRNPDQTNDQFIYTTRKNALGPFKKEIFSLSQDSKNRIAKAVEEEFDFLFAQLKIRDTRALVDKYINPVIVERRPEDF